MIVDTCLRQPQDLLHGIHLSFGRYALHADGIYRQEPVMVIKESELSEVCVWGLGWHLGFQEPLILDRHCRFRILRGGFVSPCAGASTHLGSQVKRGFGLSSYHLLSSLKIVTLFESVCVEGAW